MKVLKIENNLGKYSIDGQIYKNIEEISKEDIFEIINKILSEEIEIDEITDNNEIRMPAQKIIYEKIYEKVKSLQVSKDEIIEKNNKLFNEAYTKYKIEN